MCVHVMCVTNTMVVKVSRALADFNLRENWTFLNNPPNHPKELTPANELSGRLPIHFQALFSLFNNHLQSPSSIPQRSFE
mmetsp:Transcript_36903/g.68389  ORF Transcript_36903/g.68389 Transcript_36903/m.68389 type:complete len:80 (-) Transcript_36903:755-994(-)